MVWVVVARQGILDAIQLEAATGDPVTVAPNQGTEKGVLVQIWREHVEAEHDIRQPSLTIGRKERHKRAAVGHDPSLQAAGARQPIDLDRRAVGGGSENLLCDAHKVVCSWLVSGPGFSQPYFAVTPASSLQEFEHEVLHHPAFQVYQSPGKRYALLPRQLAPHDLRPIDHRAELGARRPARGLAEATVRRHAELLGCDVA